MRVTGMVRILVPLATLLSFWVIIQTYSEHRGRAISLRSWLGSTRKPMSSPPQPRHKCENKKDCPADHFAFRIISGAANVVGPSICFEDRILMSTVKNNIGRGLNIALVNGELGPHGPKALCTANFRTASTTVHMGLGRRGASLETHPDCVGNFQPLGKSGQLLKVGSFDMYSGDVTKLETFLEDIKYGTIMLAATYDDASTKMNDKVRALFSALGSRHVNQLGFRDNWVFLGAKGMKDKSPFEEHIKNDQKTNKYDGWPELLEMEGCAPRKQD
ncbi:protein FAM3D isoform X1 [Lagopus muta]|uniref:protein FAM3D isoform X1 n=1 Tax=Lagopus muta TaxID=64668 RepID=UPI0020A18165|nr:protein FAM3D isoform X1 [Lagopus muta]